MRDRSPHVPADPVPRSLVAALLDRAARAFPATVEQDRDGWRLRHTDSSRWWSGAVLAHGDGRASPYEDGIAEVERFYAGHGAETRFQVCPGCPPGLDGALARRGYRSGDGVSLQVADAGELAHRSATPCPEVRVADRLDAAWFAAWRAASGTPDPRGSEWQMLARVQPRSGYVTVVDGDRPVATGRAVADTGWTGVFDMATAPHARGRGAGTAVLAAIARWATRQHAPRLYLQVEQDNLPARGLYEVTGFVEVATYHYRVRSARIRSGWRAAYPTAMSTKRE